SQSELELKDFGKKGIARLLNSFIMFFSYCSISGRTQFGLASPGNKSQVASFCPLNNKTFSPMVVNSSNVFIASRYPSNSFTIISLFAVDVLGFGIIELFKYNYR